MLMIKEEMSTFLSILFNKKERKIGHFMMEKFKTFQKFLNDRINITLNLSIFFKQRFRYLNNKKINFIKVILKLDCLFYQNILILYHIILYS